MSELEKNSTVAGAIGLREIAVLVWKHRWIVLTFTAVFGAMLAGLAFLSTPVYRASAVLIPANPDRSVLGDSLGSALGSVGGLASLAGINLNAGNGNVEEALAVLQSRRFTEDFINSRNLMPVLFAKRWDSQLGTWKGSKADWPTPGKAFKVFDEKIREIVRNTKTGLITLQIDWKDRAAAADWANDLVQRLNSEMRARAIAKADASLVFLQKELAATVDVGTRESVNRLIESEIKQRMLANVTQDYALRIVDQAMIPDRDDPIWPKKGLLIAAGLLFGFLAGVVCVLLIEFGRQPAYRGG